MTAANATDADVIRELGAQPAEEVTSDDHMRLTGESLSQPSISRVGSAASKRSRIMSASKTR